MCLRLLFTLQYVHTHMSSTCNWHVNCDTAFCATKRERPFLKVKMEGGMFEKPYATIPKDHEEK